MTGRSAEELDAIRRRLRKAAEEQRRLHADPSKTQPLPERFTGPIGFDDDGTPLPPPPHWGPAPPPGGSEGDDAGPPPPATEPPPP